MSFFSAVLLWEELLVFLELIHRNGRELLVQLQLSLGQLGQVDDHQEVLQRGYLEMLNIFDINHQWGPT